MLVTLRRYRRFSGCPEYNVTSLQTHVADEGTQAAAKPATRCGVATATWKKNLGLINAMYLHERTYPRLLDANAQYHALYKN